VITYASDAFTAQLRTSRTNLLGKTLFDFLAIAPDGPRTTALLGIIALGGMTAYLLKHSGQYMMVFGMTAFSISLTQ
jgi:hypothetical protein